MAFDAQRGRTVLFGGNVFNPAETWEWDGNAWLRQTPATQPPNRQDAAMYYDPATRRAYRRLATTQRQRVGDAQGLIQRVAAEQEAIEKKDEELTLKRLFHKKNPNRRSEFFRSLRHP